MQNLNLFDLIRLKTLLLAAVGAALFWLAGLPLPLLLGPMFACLFAALFGLPLKGVPPVSDAMRPLLGVAVGASLTPDLFGRLGEMALSIALVPFFVLVIGALGYPYFRRVWKFDHATSFYCAMPGGLQDMVIFGAEAGANVRILSLVHTTRVLVIVSAMPFLLTWIWGLELAGPLGDPANTVPVDQYVVMFVCATLGWWGGVRLGIFGAPIIGPLIVAGIATLTGLLQTRPPAEAMEVAQFFLGLGIGVKYVGITLDEIRRCLTSALGYCVVLAILSVIFAEIVIQTGVAPPLSAVLAFAPGGQAEMVLLALISGSDMAYVVTHHVVRILVVILGAPLVARLFETQDRNGSA